ncbi:STAS domain-containing protein [Nonomuraea sp. NPDC005692]|uniref:STAS domain-containing protein n=1 Tax=Nonomuraea sp. NPDC005692 TaxID=3157168 RepID=UPI0033FC1F29
MLPPSGSPASIGLHEHFIVARAAGELDHTSAGLLHRQVKDAWEATGSAGLVLDLSGVTFCDSMGIGVLVLLLRQSREQQSTLVLTDIRPGWSASGRSLACGPRRPAPDRAGAPPLAGAGRPG